MVSPDLMEQLERWTARLEADMDRLNERMSLHEANPWHASYAPLNAEMMKRVDRLENLVLSIGRWVITLLIGMLIAISSILVVAWRILEAKPGAP